MRLSRIFRMFLMAIVFSFIFSLLGFLFSDALRPPPKPQPVASVRGFENGTKLTYTVLNNAGIHLQGEKLIESENMIDLTQLDLTGIDNDSPLIYDFQIKESDDDPYNVTLKFDPATGRAEVAANGLRSFSEINLETGSEKLQTQTDWAGLYNEDGISYIDDKKNASFKLAFYSPSHIMSDVPRNPRIIEVLSAPGGGNASNDGVNQFTPTHCGSPPLSTCLPALQQATQAIVDNYVASMQLMAEQLSVVMMDYVMIIGTFIDGKQQLETQRLQQTLVAEAHKDYQVSEQMCQFGSFVKTIADTETRAGANALSLNKILYASYENLDNSSTSESTLTYGKARAESFIKKYCNPKDNNNGLGVMCKKNESDSEDHKTGAEDDSRMNKDIDYARTLGFPLTIDMDFVDQEVEGGEEDIVALARNLYWPEAFRVADQDGVAKQYDDYMDARQVMAINGVAHGSFVSIASLKASSSDALEDQAGGAFMKALLRDFGLGDDAEIEAFLGTNPSYYAQMEMLTKKIYQNPDFYTNLYDKPANIDRIGAAIDAFKLIQARDMYDSSLRKEMLTSLMVEEALSKVQGRIKGLIASGASR